MTDWREECGGHVGMMGPTEQRMMWEMLQFLAEIYQFEAPWDQEPTFQREWNNIKKKFNEEDNNDQT